MSNIRRVMQYSNLNYYQALELPCDIFQLMVKNHYIEQLQQSEEGRKYLKECELYNETEPDIDGLFKAGLLKNKG